LEQTSQSLEPSAPLNQQVPPNTQFPGRKFKKIRKREPKQESVLLPTPSTVNDKSQAPKTECILLKVRRCREQDDIDQIYLQFDEAGSVKRTKFVTEKESLQQALNLFKIRDEGEKVPEAKEEK